MINNVQAHIERQLGNYAWRNYDTAIKQLRCTKHDEFNQISSSSDEACVLPIFACKFAQNPGYEHILALANEDGQIAVHNTEIKNKNKTQQQRFGKVAHHNAIFDLAWMFGQMKLVSVSGDHTARLFDISNNDIVEQQIFQGHTRSVKTVAFRKNDPAVFATGARDGAIFVWDTRATTNTNFITQPDRIISNSHNIPNTPSSRSKKKLCYTNCSVSGANSVTSLVFQDDMTLISCGAGDGAIKVWDLRKNYLLHKREPLPKYTLPYAGSSTRNGFSNLLIDCSGVRLYANCMDNTIYCYNIATYQQYPIMTYCGHQNSTFYIKSSMSADGNYLLSGSSDQNAYIWNTNKSTPLVSLTGHTAEVTCVAWCQTGSIKLVTCSDDMKHKIWRIHEADLPDDWVIEGRGSAVPINDKTETKLLKTPSSRKRILSLTPHSERKRTRICEKCQMLTPGSSESMNNCENCVVSVFRSSKRSASRAELSPEENECKRLQAEKSGARKLFGPLLDANNSKESDVLATILEENSPIKDDCIFSPTSNLPNFVIDGSAPHLRNFSPQKKRDKDWLTKMRIEHSFKVQMEELSSPTSPKQPRLSECPVNPCTSTRKSKKNSTPRAQSPLLKFFRVTNNSLRNCDYQCASHSVSSPGTTDITQRSAF